MSDHNIATHGRIETHAFRYFRHDRTRCTFFKKTGSGVGSKLSRRDQRRVLRPHRSIEGVSLVRFGPGSERKCMSA